MNGTTTSIEQLSINTIRTLSIDAVEKANSGHPGLPMGSAPMAYELWTKFMRINPANPLWPNRDRFVLSAGHGSMLLYSLLHLSGYDLPLEELKNFRQWGSRTPGHPEFGHTPGVDATTGPLGQGFAMAVGMAMAEAHLAKVYNRDHFSIIDHYTYVLCGDGDLMEGISSEAASLAGHLQLEKLIVLYDSNNISLDGELSMSFSENVQQRFAGYEWHVQKVVDGNNLEEIHAAIVAAQNDVRPSLIEVKTTIGYGSPNKGGTSKAHGAPLGAEEVKLTKQFYGWPQLPSFFIPEEVKAHFAHVKSNGIEREQAWNEQLIQYKKSFPELGKEFEMTMRGELPSGWDANLPVYSPTDEPVASRNSAGRALDVLSEHIPMLIGGSADLETSTKANIDSSTRFSAKNYNGRNLYFGVREFAMAAATNGIMLHGGLRPFCATFFTFSDYLRPAMRLAAMMKLPVIYIFTHDSIGLGEDGPTHQPIEQLSAIRGIPGMTVLRPADGNETSQAWRFAVENNVGPVVLILSRQNLVNLEGTDTLSKLHLKHGGYVLSDDSNGQPRAQLLATGSEVSLAINAQKKLQEQGIHVRVISMPSWELFEKQSRAYKDSVILPQVKARLAIEMASPMGWDRYVGDTGEVLAIDHYGASAPASIIMENFGFTVENVVSRVKAMLDEVQA